jgi:hypothetical protein
MHRGLRIPDLGEPVRDRRHRTDHHEEGRALVERLGGRWTSTGGMCRCPAHDDRRPSLSVRIGRSRLLLHCFAGCRVEDVLRVLKADRLIDAAPPAEDAGVPAAEPPVAAEAPLKLWGGARPLAGSPAERYLAARCLDSGSVELRFHPRTPHGPRPFTRFLPAMIAAVRDGAELVGVHRTFLDVRLSRVAALSHPKCGLGPFGQGAVRLHPLRDTLLGNAWYGALRARDDPPGGDGTGAVPRQ